MYFLFCYISMSTNTAFTSDFLDLVNWGWKRILIRTSKAASVVSQNSLICQFFQLRIIWKSWAANYDDENKFDSPITRGFTRLLPNIMGRIKFILMPKFASKKCYSRMTFVWIIDYVTQMLQCFKKKSSKMRDLKRYDKKILINV